MNIHFRTCKNWPSGRYVGQKWSNITQIHIGKKDIHLKCIFDLQAVWKVYITTMFQRSKQNLLKVSSNILFIFKIKLNWIANLEMYIDYTNRITKYKCDHVNHLSMLYKMK